MDHEPSLDEAERRDDEAAAAPVLTHTQDGQETAQQRQDVCGSEEQRDARPPTPKAL